MTAPLPPARHTHGRGRQVCGRWPGWLPLVGAFLVACGAPAKRHSQVPPGGFGRQAQASRAPTPRQSLEVGTSDPLTPQIPLYEDELADPTYTGPLPALVSDDHHRKHPDPQASTAGMHFGADDPIHQFAAQQCPLVPQARRALCPLLGQVADVRELADGARVTLERSARDVAEHIRCHQAYAATVDTAMPACPIFVPGVETKVVAPHVVRFTATGERAQRQLIERLHEHLGRQPSDGGVPPAP